MLRQGHAGQLVHFDRTRDRLQCGLDTGLQEPRYNDVPVYLISFLSYRAQRTSILQSAINVRKHLSIVLWVESMVKEESGDMRGRGRGSRLASGKGD